MFMDGKQGFEQFLATQSVQIPILNFVTNILLAAVLAFILGLVYTRFASSLSNRRNFSANFVLIATTTMLIISIVKSSLALSLGLVGALSIVRFRAAIKEPEELAYLFLTIAIGLGLGADQAIITIVAFAIIMLLIVIKNWSKSFDKNPNLYLSLSSKKPKNLSIDEITKVLKEHCSSIDLRRFDENHDRLEATFLVELANFNKLEQAKQELQLIDNSLSISFLDNKGIQ